MKDVQVWFWCLKCISFTFWCIKVTFFHEYKSWWGSVYRHERCLKCISFAFWCFKVTDLSLIIHMYLSVKQDEGRSKKRMKGAWNASLSYFERCLSLILMWDSQPRVVGTLKNQLGTEGGLQLVIHASKKGLIFMHFIELGISWDYLEVFMDTHTADVFHTRGDGCLKKYKYRYRYRCIHRADVFHTWVDGCIKKATERNPSLIFMHFKASFAAQGIHEKADVYVLKTAQNRT